MVPIADELLELVNTKLSPFTEVFTLSDLDIMSVNSDGSVSSSTGHVEDSQAARPPVRPSTPSEEEPEETPTVDENGNPIVIDPDTGLPVTPGDGTTDPGTSGTTDPGTGDETTDPGTGTTDPDTGGETTDPGTGTTDPGTDGGTTDPGTGTADPGTGVSDPGTGTSTPGTGGETADSGTGTDSQPSAGDGGGDSASAAPDDGFVIVS